MRWVVGVVVLASVVASGAAASPAAVQQSAPDDVLMHVTLDTDGNTDWRIEHRYRLDDAESEQAFESLRADIRNNTSVYRTRFADRMNRTLQDAEDATGREMALRNVTVSTRRVQLPQAYGVVTYRFEWRGFAAVDGDEIRADDALAGLFLDDGTALVVAWPSGYHATAVAPDADQRDARSVRWVGPREFGADEPRVVLAPGTPTADGTTAAPPRVDVRDSEGSGGEWLPVGILPGAVGLSLLALLVVFAVRWLPVAVDDGPPTDGSADGASPTEEPTADGPDPALLTNEERVLALLEDRGGRVKQQTIAAELDWTDAKTSKVVRGLREDGEIEVVRLGRENVVGLPGEIDI